MIDEKIKEFEQAIINLNLEKAPELVKELLALKVPSSKIFESISNAMDAVGQKYEAGEYFLSELIMAGEVVKEVLRIIQHSYKKSERKFIGKVVLATVKGDLHDIGKNIVSMLLQSAGFEVYDLGVDVPAEKIIDAVKKSNAQIVGLSALLTTTLPEIKNVIEELKKAGLREKVKVIVGGAALNKKIAERYGADSYAKTAVEGLKICKEWILN